MRAMRTYAKKKEHVNAPVGPFTTFSHCAYGYNIRNELVCSRRDAFDLVAELYNGECECGE